MKLNIYVLNALFLSLLILFLYKGYVEHKTVRLEKLRKLRQISNRGKTAEITYLT